VELPVLMEAVSPLGMDPEKRAGMANAIGQELMQIMEFNKSEETRGGDRKICPRCYVLYRYIGDSIEHICCILLDCVVLDCVDLTLLDLDLISSVRYDSNLFHGPGEACWHGQRNRPGADADRGIQQVGRKSRRRPEDLPALLRALQVIW
jgi:hypothetical protein